MDPGTMRIVDGDLGKARPESAAPADAVSPAACPLCGGGNACAMAGPAGTDPKAPCWCVVASFSEALLARVPPQARGRVCICAACATASAGPGER